MTCQWYVQLVYVNCISLLLPITFVGFSSVIDTKHCRCRGRDYDHDENMTTTMGNHTSITENAFSASVTCNMLTGVGHLLVECKNWQCDARRHTTQRARVFLEDGLKLWIISWKYPRITNCYRHRVGLRCSVVSNSAVDFSALSFLSFNSYRPIHEDEHN